MEKAFAFEIKKDYANAAKAMADYVKEFPQSVDGYSNEARYYFTMGRYTDAIPVYKAGIQNVKYGNRSFSMPLARAYLYSYHPLEALDVIRTNTYGSKQEWNKLEKQALFMAEALVHKLKDTLRNVGPSINSPYPEMYPYISSDTQTLYFTRALNGMDEDFYRSTVDSCGGWFYARNMGSPPNTSSHEAAQMISADNHYLFFMRCGNRSENGWAQGGCDLYMAYTGDSVWSVPESFGATINTPAYEGMPCLSADNRELYFVSDREGGFGGLDLWMSEFKDGLWQAPRNLGPAVNTPGNETAPFLHIDNKTLYFASDGLTGFGASDLFICRRIDDTTWTKPQNLGYPINSVENESSMSVTTDGQKAYISSNRNTMDGDHNIYETSLPASLQPVPVAVVNGFAYDSITKNKLNYASINIFDANSNLLYHFVSNRGDGSYMITLPVGHSYHYQADRIGYLDINNILTLNPADANQKLELDIPLLPQDYQAPIHDSLIVTIHFPRNSAKLTDADNAEISKKLDPWLMEKNVVFYVNGYTDATGTPLINEQLSYQRAGLVTEVLSAMGIDPNNIQSKGWGEANPIAPNDVEENMYKNRRVEVIIRR